jgi:signal transduction histidine kinase
MKHRGSIQLKLIHTLNLLKKSINFLYSVLIKSKSEDEDTRRREFILNLILLGTIGIMLWSNFFILISTLANKSTENYISLIPFSSLTLLFIGLYIASRFGKISIASYCLVAIYFLGTLYGAYRWGITLPAIILSFALLITMASILISSKVGLATSILSIITITIFGYEEVVHNSIPEWRHDAITTFDLIEYSVILFTITLVSWISTRDIEKSLIRARKSEKELRAERDSLEVTITERTRQLELAQAEKMSQLYRFAEFGRLSSGLFHDLVNPLTSIVLNLNNIQESVHPDVRLVKEDLTRAVKASQRMDSLISTITKQIKTEAPHSAFLIKDIVNEVFTLFSHRANLLNIKLQCLGKSNLHLFGNPLKFHQVITNLVSNAFDSYKPVNHSKTQRLIAISITATQNHITVKIKDNGQGIAEEILPQIFNPFFSTKPSSKGMGLGLSMVKSIISNEFNGTITVESKKEIGTVFTLTFPQKELL